MKQSNTMWSCALWGALALELIGRSSIVQAMVRTKMDTVNHCVRYFWVNPDIKQNVLGTTVVSAEESTFGITFKNLEIDFDRREIKIDAYDDIPLTSKDMFLISNIRVSADSEDFGFVLNSVSMINGKFYPVRLDEICVNSEKQLIYWRN